MKSITYLFGFICFLLLVGCSDFFEEESQNQAYVKNMQDLDELLVGEAYINVKGFSAWPSSEYDLMRNTASYFPWIHVMDDDVTHFADGGYYDLSQYSTLFHTPERMLAAYGWQPNPFLDQSLTEFAPDDWKNAYKRIAVVNAIISQWDELSKEELDKKFCNRVKGEAYFLRAYNYFWLVNIYAQPYAIETANEELGVPLKLVEEVEDKFFARASVQAVYDQIRNDLQESIKAFKQAEKIDRPVRANHGAACLLMSRVCLYMEDYQGAIAYADSVLQQGKYRLMDYDTIAPGKGDRDEHGSTTFEESPETIFTQGGYIMGFIHYGGGTSGVCLDTYATSQDLLDCYLPDDRRGSLFFVAVSKYPECIRCLKLRSNSARIGDYMLFRLPEAYLNKAEAQAILGDEAGAKITLNELRVKRFNEGKIPSVEEEMQMHGDVNLVAFVRNERRRELCYEGHRWFDLRRYAVNSKYPFSKTIRHEKRVWQGGSDGRYVTEGYYELRPYAEDRAAYAMPLPYEEIIFNEGVLIQNEQRPERALK